MYYGGSSPKRRARVADHRHGATSIGDSIRNLLPSRTNSINMLHADLRPLDRRAGRDRITNGECHRFPICPDFIAMDRGEANIAVCAARPKRPFLIAPRKRRPITVHHVTDLRNSHIASVMIAGNCAAAPVIRLINVRLLPHARGETTYSSDVDKSGVIHISLEKQSINERNRVRGLDGIAIESPNSSAVGRLLVLLCVTPAADSQILASGVTGHLQMFR